MAAYEQAKKAAYEQRKVSRAKTEAAKKANEGRWVCPTEDGTGWMDPLAVSGGSRGRGRAEPLLCSSRQGTS